MGPMDITVSKTVVVTVGMTLRVTNRRVNVTGDATRDILMVIAAKVSLQMNHTYFALFFIYSFLCLESLILQMYTS